MILCVFISPVVDPKAYLEKIISFDLKKAIVGAGGATAPPLLKERLYTYGV